MKSDNFLSLKVLGVRLSSILKVGLIIGFPVLFFSCSDLGMEQDDPTASVKGIVTTPSSAPSLYVNSIPDSLSFRQVDLYLDKGVGATGVLTIFIHNEYGRLMDSLRVSVTSISDGASWKTFIFPSFLKLDRGSKYRISLIRTDAHDQPGKNYIFWHTSRWGDNAYPNGSNDLSKSKILDYAFRTYSEGAVDQQQPSVVGSYAVGNISRRWQEFVADYPRVYFTSLQLFLRVGANTNDSLEVHVGGVIVNTSNHADSVNYRTKLHTSSLVNGAWNTINIQGQLQRDQYYTIYVRRWGAHNSRAGKYLYWHASGGNRDLYPDGSSNLWYTRPAMDYSFKTFTQGGLDQQQVNVEDTIRIASGRGGYQTFIPRHQ